MSDLLTPDWTLQGLTPEEQLAYYKGQTLKIPQAAGTGLVASGITNLAPDPQLPGVAGYIPLTGLAERLTSFGKTVGDVAAAPLDYMFGKIGMGGKPPDAPAWMDTAGKHAEQTTEELYKQLMGPEPDPNNPAEGYAKSIGIGAGMAAPMAAPSVATALPGMIRWALPTTEHVAINTGIGAGLAGTLGALAGEISPAEAAPLPKPTTTPKSIDELLSQPLSTHVDQQLPIDQILAGFDAPTHMPFSEEGESPINIGQVLAAGAALVVSIAGARYLHNLGAEVTAAGRSARMTAPGYVDAAQAYNDSRIARTGDQISGNVVDAPLPTSNPVQSTTARMKTGLLDEDNLIRDYLKQTSENPQTADLLATKFGNVNNNMIRETKTREFLNTGEDFATKKIIENPRKLFNDIAALSKPDQKLLRDTLMGENEQDNRIINRNQARASGVQRIPEELHHDFYHQDDVALQHIINQGRINPVVSELADRFFNISRGMAEIGEARGFFTPQELQDLTKMRSHYVPDVDVNGRIVHAFGPRNTERYSGTEQVNTEPWSALGQHIDELYHQFDLADVRRMIVDHQLDLQGRFPNSAQWMYEKILPQGMQPDVYPTQGTSVAGPREQVIQVRRNGGHKFYKIDNRDMFDILSGNNSNKARMMLNSMNVARRMFSTGTTGVASLATGRIFPLVNVMRTGFQAPINRSAGFAGSLMDKYVPGGRNVYDPTNIAGAGYAFARNRVDSAMDVLSKLFDPKSTHSTTQLLASMISPQRMQVISDSLRNRYMGSITHEMRQQGIGGQGSPYRSRLPAFSAGEGKTARDVRMVSADLVPELFLANGKLGGVRPYVVRLRKAVEGTFASMSDAGHEYFYRLNRDNPNITREQLAAETRRLTGDPGVSGGNKYVQGITQTMPYSNVSMQGIRARTRALTDQPAGALGAWVGGLTTLALTSLLTAMRSPAHLNHLENELSTQQREANPTFYTHPDPTVNTQANLAQEDRLLYPLVLDIISKVLNTTAMQHDDQYHDSVFGFIKDFLGEHIEKSNTEATLHAANDVMNFANVPPIVNAFGALTGNTLNFDYDKIYNDWQNHNLSFDTFRQPTGDHQPLPNTPSGDAVLNDNDARRFSVSMTNVMGMMAGALAHVAGLKFDSWHNFMDSAGQAGHDWLQGAKDANPALNILWENQARLSTRPPIVEATQKQLAVMKQTVGSRGAEKDTGTTGGRFPLPVPTQPDQQAKVPTDPLVRQMYFTMGAQYNYIEKQLMPQITNVQKQMSAIAASPINPGERRAQTNELTRKLADNWRIVATHVDDLNAMLSRLAGKSVTVGSVDWTKDSSQFK